MTAVRRDAQIAGERQFETFCEGVALQGGNYRRRHAGNRLYAIHTRFPARRIFETETEIRPLGGQHHDADTIVEFDLCRRVTKGLRELQAEAVIRLRSIEREPSNAVVQTTAQAVLDA